MIKEGKKTKQNSRMLKKQNLNFSNSLDVYNLDYEQGCGQPNGMMSDKEKLFNLKNEKEIKGN